MQIIKNTLLNNFKNLGISSEILQALPELNILEPSEIQEKAIPILLDNQHNFIGLAATGTGKTAAFGLPLLQSIDTSDKHVQALVVAPTRELGQQISQQISNFAKYLPKVKTVAVYGGASITEQMRQLKQNPQIVIATPGRLIDMINRKAIQLGKIRFLVLDEADEMLNMGFKEDIDKILSFTPENKLTWLFSATMPNEIRKIVKKYMKGAVEISVGNRHETNENISHQYVVLKASDKTESLKRFLSHEPDMKGVVFCRTKRDTQNVAEELEKDGFRVAALHGDLSQQQRDRVMKRFKSHALHVLIATDVAARGIDVDSLTHVFHYSLPDTFEYYTHRSGRTARAGKKGISLAFITRGDMRKLKDIEKFTKAKFTKVLIPNMEDVQSKKVAAWVNKINETEVLPAIKDFHQTGTRAVLEAMDKEELIDKLISYQLKKYVQKTSSDLNLSEGKDSGSEIGGRNMDWFKISIGKKDNIRLKEFLDFIMDVTRLNGRDIGDIIIKKEHSFFQIDKGSSDKIPAFFEGIMIDDKELIVKKEEPSIRDIQSKQQGKKERNNFVTRRKRPNEGPGRRAGQRRRSGRGRN